MCLCCVHVCVRVACMCASVLCTLMSSLLCVQLLDGPDSKFLGNKGYYFGDLILSDNSQHVTLSDMIL